MRERGAVYLGERAAGPAHRGWRRSVSVWLSVIALSVSACTTSSHDVLSSASSRPSASGAGTANSMDIPSGLKTQSGSARPTETASSPEPATSTGPANQPVVGPATKQTSSAVSGAIPKYAHGVSVAIEKAMKDDGTPGAVVLVRSAAGDWTSAFGVRALGKPAPVQVGDVFRLADITSTMTATIVLQLAKKGLLSLDDPIAKFVKGVPNGDRITIRELGTYRSGLFDYEQDRTFQSLYTQNPSRSWTPQDVLAFAFSHPSGAPGTESYSATNFVLLGLVIEKVTGAPASSAFSTSLFKPLGLTHIGLADGAPLPGPHADGYSWTKNPFDDPVLTDEQRHAAAAGTLSPTNQTADDPTWAFTAGAAYSDAASLADLFTGIVSGSLLDNESRQQLTAGMNTLGPIEDAASVQYGFGIARYGQYLFYSGSMPGYSAFAAVDPKTATTIVILTNLAYAPEGDSPVADIFHVIADAVEPVKVAGK